MAPDANLEASDANLVTTDANFDLFDVNLMLLDANFELFDANLLAPDANIEVSDSNLIEVSDVNMRVPLCSQHEIFGFIGIRSVHITVISSKESLKVTESGFSFLNNSLKK